MEDRSPARTLPVDNTKYGAAALDAVLASGVRDRLGRFVGMAVLAQSEGAFFDALVHFLSSAFDADVVLIAATTPPGDGARSARTIAAFENGSRVENFEYELPGTPCENVVSRPTVCLYTDGVAEAFPSDAMLVEMGIQGYCGIPLLSDDGCMIGLLAVLTRHPITDGDVLMGVLRVYGSRASLELQHLLALESRGADPDFERLRTERDRELAAALEHLRGM